MGNILAYTDHTTPPQCWTTSCFTPPPPPEMRARHASKWYKGVLSHGARTVQCFWDGSPTCTPNGPHRNTPRVLIFAPCSPYWHTRILQFLVRCLSQVPGSYFLHPAAPIGVRQSGDKPGQLRFRHCGSGGHRIRKRTHGARTVQATPPKCITRLMITGTRHCYGAWAWAYKLCAQHAHSAQDAPCICFLNPMPPGPDGRQPP